MFVLDHVAILVDEIECSAQYLTSLGLAPGPIEVFPGEGTREMYLSLVDCASRILLLEPIAAGPYRSAMDRRGPGLHHVAFFVENLVEYAASLTGSGWFLHPASLKTARDMNTAWLNRPGMGALVELHESMNAPAREAPGPKPALIEVEIPGVEVRRVGLIEALRCAGVSRSPDREAVLVLGGKRIQIREIARRKS
jgi:methylmalonyl-CoA/ethylmalonyl-CoA epimerase